MLKQQCNGLVSCTVTLCRVMECWRSAGHGGGRAGDKVKVRSESSLRYGPRKLMSVQGGEMSAGRKGLAMVRKERVSGVDVSTGCVRLPYTVGAL